MLEGFTSRWTMPRMQVGQALGNGDKDRPGIVRAESWFTGQAIRERAALAQLHDEERLPANVRIARIDVVDADDPGVGGRGQRASLILEALREIRIPRKIRQQDLDGDIPVESLVMGSVDRRHPSGTDRAEDPIAIGEQVSDGWHRPSVPDAELLEDAVDPGIGQRRGAPVGRPDART
jgi:hypothetical protein